MVTVLRLLAALESRFLFFPTAAADDWSEPDDFQKCDLTFSAGSTAVHAWWCPRDGATGAVLYCHGNGGNLSHRLRVYRALQTAHNVSVLAFDYPGYGKSGGRPSEAGCYAAAQAAFDWLTTTAGVAAERVILFGESLGGGVAVELATRRPCRALVLFSTFTSLPDVAKNRIPFLPAQTLMSNRFESVRKLAAIRRPVFIAHGDADRLIPLHLAEAMYAAANEPKALHVDPGRGHTLMLTPAFHAALDEFLTKHAP
jgi:pimeloyl-ACP methyl ester carboxylesterase